MFSLRIVNVDHYMSAPKSGLDLTYSQFRGTQIKSVPVFRIFGSTPSGNKTCLHVHGVFPYILVPYSGEDEAGRLMYQLASSLDKAINVSQNSSHSTRQHVFKIAQVSGRPFYGYHSQDHQFLKIFFYNPLIVKRACDLLQNGAVCGTKFQIHEGHVPFTLQFFIDYNLYGMSFINLKSVVYRRDACPQGIAAGELVRESFCELEADAVAVDILNRLTIQGELAVNPGLAAIWEEEKKRLKRDALEVSQRPQPPPTMSELLLREKLSGNLKYQGKCKTPLKENIPYPAETQRTSGSGVLDASVLDTHSLSSLAMTLNNVNEETIIDEELVLSLTQSSNLSSSLDQSLFEVLDNLAAQNELLNATMTQEVEDDSILGSQMIQDQDMFGNDISDGELEVLNYSLPPDLLSDNHPEDENSEDTDENFEESIPQLDGVGDFGGKKKKSKQCKKEKIIRVGSPTVEAYLPPDVEDLLNTAKENNFWPESVKQETLEEIFSEEEPYNSPIDNFEDRCESVDIGLINVSLINSFETVLTGDPSFTSKDLASEDALFQPVDDCSELDENKTSIHEKSIIECIGSKKLLVDKNSNFDIVPLSNPSLDATEMEKSLMLVESGEEFLNTSQLDEILDEDLNQGLKIICEKSPEQDYEDNWIKPEDIKANMGIGYILDDDLLGNNVELLNFNIDNEFDERTEGDDLILDTISDIDQVNLDDIQTTVELKEDGVALEDPSDESYPKIVAMTNAEKEETSHPQETGPLTNRTSPKRSSKEANSNLPNKHLKNETSPRKLPEKPNNNSSNGNIKNDIPHKTSLSKGASNKLIVNLFQKKKKIERYNDLSEMTRKEIETYYLQLKSLTEFLSQRCDIEKPQQMLWRPIRQNKIVENLGQKRKRKCKPKITPSEVISKKSKLSHEEILKMKNCQVKIHKLTNSEISYLTGKPMDLINPSSVNQIEICRTKSNEGKLKIEWLTNNSNHHQSAILTETNFGEEMSINVKQERSLMLVKNNKKLPPSQQLSPKKLSVKEPLSQSDKKSKQIYKCAKKSHFFKESRLKMLNNLPTSQHPEMKSVCASDSLGTITPNQDINLKKKKMCKEVHVEKINQNISTPEANQSLSIGDENNLRIKKKEKNNKRMFGSSLEETKKTLNDLTVNDSSSSKNNNKTPGKNQSLSFKLNTNCVIKLLPLATDVTSDLYTARDLLTRRPSDKKVPKKLASQECKVNKKNVQDQVGNTRKKPFRIYSLDGTADSSSSDESVDKPQVNTTHYSTPNKRRKSKSYRSPKNYVPLSIEIKKSPKVKLGTETKDVVASVSSEKLSEELRKQNEAKDVHISESTKDKSENAKCSEGRKMMAPVVIVNRLPTAIKLSSDTDISANKKDAIPSTSRPEVKRLKVLVKRLSLDTPGHSLEHKRVLKLRRRLHRSASEPVTVV